MLLVDWLFHCWILVLWQVQLFSQAIPVLQHSCQRGHRRFAGKKAGEDSDLAPSDLLFSYQLQPSMQHPLVTSPDVPARISIVDEKVHVVPYRPRLSLCRKTPLMGRNG